MIPLYIANYNNYETNIIKLKDWIIKYISMENSTNDRFELLNLIRLV